MTELERLVNLVPYLRAHQGVTVDEVAREFGVTRQRVLADLSILQFVGLPGGYFGDLFEVDLGGAREHGDIFVHNVEALGRPMRLTHDQVASLSVALQMVMAMGGDDAGARSALAKLEELSRGATGVEVDLDAGTAAHRAALSRALQDHRAVSLTYRPGGAPDHRTAVVEPARLRADGGYAYLDAWSRDRDDWRTYRLDRIDDVTLLDDDAPAREVPASLDTWFADAPAEFTVTVTEAGRWCADYHPTSAVERVEEGWRITFPLVSTDWAARLLLRLGDAVVDVEQDVVVDAARDLSTRALARYRGAP